MHPEVGTEENGSFWFEKFWVDVFDFVLSPFDVVNMDGKENFFL